MGILLYNILITIFTDYADIKALLLPLTMIYRLRSGMIYRLHCRSQTWLPPTMIYRLRSGMIYRLHCRSQTYYYPGFTAAPNGGFVAKHPYYQYFSLNDLACESFEEGCYHDGFGVSTFSRGMV
jgi:hypothetical protein